VPTEKRPFFTRYTTSLWVRFLRFNLLSHKRLEDDLERLHLTPPQFYVLATIGYAGGLPFGEIGEKLMVTVSNLTGIVDRLEEKQFLQRFDHPGDRRVYLLELTRAGRALVQELHARLLVVGPDFALGHGREGTPAVLSALGREMGFTVEVVPPLV